MTDDQKARLLQIATDYREVSKAATKVVTGIGRIQRSKKGWPFGGAVKAVDEAARQVSAKEDHGWQTLATWANNEE